MRRIVLLEITMIACQTELDCIHCEQMTDHTIVYASGYIKRTICNHCHYILERSALVLVWCYCHDLPKRGFALTQRLKHEAQHHPLSFVLSLPRRMIDKPIELSREFADLCFA